LNEKRDKRKRKGGKKMCSATNIKGVILVTRAISNGGGGGGRPKKYCKEGEGEK